MLSGYTAEVTLENTAEAPLRTNARISAGPRIAAAVLSFAVGAIYGAVGTVAHQDVFRVGGLSLPMALVLALLGALALLIGFRLLFADRLPVFCVALGMVSTIALFSVASAGGSILIPQGILGLVWTVAPVLLATVVVAWPRMPQRTPTPVGGAVSPAPADDRYRPEA